MRQGRKVERKPLRKEGDKGSLFEDINFCNINYLNAFAQEKFARSAKDIHRFIET
ncbi:hypothetical protein SAMN05216386_1194 [Nitrosospira briensis]|uniref:Uncharacterized protein n=1 Tax=Nitrosospira briensis TaxID=35799 RepID=A0A1I5A4I3_9PROT|nr:hypothetical protein SAMN05216386_1194 [Nitrosospira briensis]